jgi:hypothetical protein
MCLKAWVLFLMMLSFSACRKKGGVTGIVINDSNGEPIEGVRINLEQQYSIGVGYVGWGNKKGLGETFTDSHGEFAFNYKFKDGERYDYQLNIVQGDFYSQVDTTSEISEFYIVSQPYENRYWISDHNGEYVTFRAVPSGRLKVIPRDIEPFDNAQLSITAGDTTMFGSVSVYDSGQEFPEYERVPTNGKIFLMSRIIKGGYLHYDIRTIALVPFTKQVYYFDY